MTLPEVEISAQNPRLNVKETRKKRKRARSKKNAATSIGTHLQRANKGSKKLDKDEKCGHGKDRLPKVPRLGVRDTSMSPTLAKPDDMEIAEKDICFTSELIVRTAKKERKFSFGHSKLTDGCQQKIITAFCKLRNFTFLKVKFRNCGITNKFLKNIKEVMKKKKIKIEALDLSGNEKLDMKTVEELRIISQFTVVDLSVVEFSKSQIEILGTMKLKVLKLKNSSFRSGSIAKALANLIDNGLEELFLVDSKISVQELEKIAKLMKQKGNLKHFDLSHVNLGRKGMEAVSEILNKNGIERLSLSDCGLTKELLDVLEKSSNCEVLALNISSNSCIAQDDIKAVAKLAEKLSCEELDISCNDLTEKHIRELLSAKPPKQVRALFMGENFFQDWVEVSHLVVKWEIKSLDVTESRIYSEDIRAFANGLENYKLEHVDLSHRSGIKTEEKNEALKILEEKTTTLIY